MQLQHFYHSNTGTLSYLLFSSECKDALIIDPVLDLDMASGELSDTSAHELIDFINSKNLSLKYILETHVHADHLSSSQIIKKCFPTAKLGINKNIRNVQDYFKVLYNTPKLKTDGSQFDFLYEDGQELDFAGTKIKVLSTPGHTPTCSCFYIDDMLFTGDALFMPDFGTGRCDFPNGDASLLFDSIKNNIYALPDETRVFVGHDYRPNGRELKFETSVRESKNENIHIKAETKKEEFVNFRSSRDKTLDAPKLLLPSIQVNMRAGHLPEREANGRSFLKIPLNEEGLG